MNILILGSGPGLSRSIAKKFGENEFKVTLVSRNEEKLKNEKAWLVGEGISVNYYVGDISLEETLSNIVDKVINESGLPDVIVFNVFANQGGGFESETWDSLKHQIDINVGSAFNLLKYVLPLYRKAGKGDLFFTGGGFGIHPYPDYLGVSMGKAALRNLVQAAATEMKDTDIHVATVTVTGIIGGGDPKYAPDKIAENYWTLYLQEKPDFQTEIIY